MTAEVIVSSDLHPVQVVGACLEAVEDALAGLPSGELPDGGGDGGDVGDLLARTVAVEARLAELRLRLSRAAEVTEAARTERLRVAAASTDAWLASLTGTSRAVMNGGLWLARMLSERYPAVRVAFARGELGEAHARVIVSAAERMPAAVTSAQRDTAVEALVARAVAERLDPGRLRRVARRMLGRISRDLADQHQADLLGAEERAAEDDTWFTLCDNGDGTWAGRFTIPDLHGRMLTTVLEHLTSPRRLTQDAAGRTVVDETIEGTANGGVGGLSWSQHLSAGLCELIEHLPTDGWANHGRVGATIMVHLDQHHLLDGLAAAHMDTGGDLTAGQARRLACNAGLLPAVFNGPSVPLDLGRQTRLHSKAQRAVLSAAYDTCAAEGCRRPFAWTEIHHKQPWSAGGPTNLANAIPLCGWHHHRATDHRYNLTYLPSGEVRLRTRRPARQRLPPPPPPPQLGPPTIYRP